MYVTFELCSNHSVAFRWLINDEMTWNLISDLRGASRRMTNFYPMPASCLQTHIFCLHNLCWYLYLQFLILDDAISNYTWWLYHVHSFVGWSHHLGFFVCVLSQCRSDLRVTKSSRKFLFTLKYFFAFTFFLFFFGSS